MSLHSDDQKINSTELDEARRKLKRLQKILEKDPGAAFREDLIDAYAVVREHDPAEWTRAKKQLQKAGVSIRDLQAAIRKQTGPKLQVVHSDGEKESRTAGDFLGPDCPCPELMIPASYVLTENTTVQMKNDFDSDLGKKVEFTVAVAHAPILITKRLRDVDDGRESLELAYRAQEWRRMTVDRRTALDKQQILELANYGFPVSSLNAPKVVKFLHSLEACNATVIPTSLATSHLGWQGKQGNKGFLCGRQLVRPDGKVAPADSQSGIEFRGLDVGDEQIANGIRAEGSSDRWLKIVRPVGDHPRVLFGFCASFVPPLLSNLHAPNFILDYANRTSTGKTTAERVAASPWGNPNENEADSLILSWDTTAVYVERAGAVLSGLPMFLDETKRAKDPLMVAKMLYAVAHGRGRSRANVRSLARTRTFQTVLFSTGESPATGFTQDAGTRARCIEIRGHPFGARDEETARLVANLNSGLRSNYGHAGPLFVQCLLQSRDLWEALKDHYAESIDKFAASVPDDMRVDLAVVNRLAHYFAAVSTAALVMSFTFVLPFDYDDALKEIWYQVIADSCEAAAGERALRDVASWARSNKEKFFGRHQTDRGGKPRIPPSGWAGRWDSGSDWTTIAFYPTVLHKVLEGFGYEPVATLEEWRERGWLDTDTQSRLTKRFRVGKDREYLIALGRRALNEVEG